MIDEVKITVIATGFAPANDVSDVKEVPQVKPVVFGNKPTVEDVSVPPLIRAAEEAEKAQAPVVEEVVAPVPPIVEPEVVKEPELVVEDKKPEEKGRELPAFMRKLFKR